MFVSNNSIAAVEQYFKEKLETKFSNTEIRYMAKMFISDRLGFSFEDYIVYTKTTCSESDLLHFRSVIKRLLKDEPFQYILGYTYFADLKIACSPSALVPRPETEELIYWILEDNKTTNPVIEDWCTGTGCIALALKNGITDANVNAFDLSESAIALSKQNAKHLKLDVKFEIADALNQIKTRKEIDIIVSNPPYIPNKEKRLMHVNVLDFEPEMALFVDDNDPLLFYREIGRYAYDNLKIGGSLFFELHEDFALATKELMISLGFFNAEIRKDLQGKERMLKAIKL